MGSYRAPEEFERQSVHQSAKEAAKAEPGRAVVRRIAPCHSFSKIACRREVLVVGTTHVAVGFVDLSSLLYGTLYHLPGPNDRSPLLWVGYERSPYACAKTAVIARLFQDSASEDDILQVWFSSSWSHSAHISFRKALSALLNAKFKGSVSPEVLAVWRHWQAHTVSLKQARELWLNDMGKDTSLANTYIGNWKQRADRLALCSYLLTGEVLHGDVGSVTMFALPEHMTRADQESFLSALPEKELWKSRHNSEDIVHAGLAVLRLKIRNLKRTFSLGEVEVEVRHDSVEPENVETLKSIAAMKPWTISWNNVCDNLPPADFHTMARKCCESKATVQFGCSMKWAQSVKGASSLDFFGRQRALDNIIEMSHIAIEHGYTEHRLHDILLFPPNENIMKIADTALAHEMHSKWLEAFFSPAGLRSLEEQVAQPEISSFSVLKRTVGTLFMTWSYDTTCRLDNRVIG